ncbi:hypothetical protein NDU88_006482 [Pleurodeles waltl]|uniref:Uncharacterized protein n=1 Tax=Pleurodeles waltl TaxID=8319 RepID=A0AAV7TEG7_PLEWA|nr:hypothetical protein NDU88_006480 [Pleurodeles waltl]KAJ1174662.1 hypothetical protein NDU88_006482 [Pleurodeles waltl]
MAGQRTPAPPDPCTAPCRIRSPFGGASRPQLCPRAPESQQAERSPATATGQQTVPDLRRGPRQPEASPLLKSPRARQKSTYGLRAPPLKGESGVLTGTPPSVPASLTSARPAGSPMPRAGGGPQPPAPASKCRMLVLQLAPAAGTSRCHLEPKGAPSRNCQAPHQPHSPCPQ